MSDEAYRRQFISDLGIDYAAIEAERPKCVTGAKLYDECMRQWREWARNATREAAETFREFLGS